MKKEFVPYELAVKLKQLGFDEPCFGHFGSITEPEELQIFPNTESCLEPEDMTNSNLDYGLSCTAPTLSQAFRWFKEKYKLDSMVQPTYSTKYLYRMFHIEGKTKVQIYGAYMGKAFKTYEEAEIACLDKLIEIVETRTK